MQPFEQRDARLDGLFVILRKISNGNLVPPGDHAAVDRKFAIRRIHETRRIAQQRPQHGRLPRAVAAQQRDFFAARDGRGEVLESPRRSSYDFDSPLISRGCRPEGRLFSNRI